MANLLSTSVTGTVNSTGNMTAAGFTGNANVGGTGAATWHPSGIYVGSTQWLYGTQYRNNSSTSGQGQLYFDGNYGYGMVGLYDSTRYQAVFAMGDSYKLPVDGSGTGSLYGIAWTHTNVGGQSKAGLGHQALFMMDGRTYTAIGAGIWTDGTITTTSHGTSANWNTAYGWGNHASAGYLTSVTNISGNAATATYATTAGSAPNGSNSNSFYNVTAGNGNGIKFWDSDAYKISMGNSSLYQYGTVTDYSIKTQMNDADPGRGFTWGRISTAPIASLNATSGNMQIAGTFSASNFSGTSSGTNTGDQTNIAGNAATATNVAWTGVTGRPTALSQFSNDLGNYGGWITSSGSISGSAGSASYARYLPNNYNGDVRTNPQSYFDYQQGLNVAMTGAWSVWSDTLWINGYSGGDVPWMCALHFLRNSEPRMAISAQTREASAYGTYYEVITAYNIASQSVSYSSTAGNSNSISNAVGNTHTWTGANYFRSNLGATSGALTAPPLQVYCTGGNSAFMSFHRSGNYAVNFGLDSDNVLRMGGWSATANRWQLDMSGNMTVAGDVTAFSDARVKTNVQTIENALDKTLALRGVSYNRTDSDDTRTKIGVIAQETLEVLPEVVNQDNSGMYNVSYGNMTALLIEAIKEQQAQIEDLKLEVKKLRGE